MPHRMSARLCLSGALALLVIGAQEPSFRISVNLVQIDATVTDSHGKPVRDLTQSDFEVFLDGKPQPITHFSHIQTDSTAATDSAVSTAPKPESMSRAATRLKPEQVSRTVVIFVDDLSMSAQSVPFVRRGVLETIEKRIGQRDLTAIVRASAGLGALQDFTTDKAMLRAAADQIRWYPSGRGEISAYRALGTDPTRDLEEYNAVPGGAFTYQEEENYRETIFTVGVLDSLRRVVHGMARLPGRKSVIVLSDRLPVAVREITDGPMEARSTTKLDASGPILNRMGDCIDQAARSGVVVYAIDTRSLSSLTITAADESKMIHKVGVAQGVEGGELVMKERHEIHDQDQAGGWYLAKETGGLMIPEANDIGASISRIYADMSSYYVLGFHPPEEAFERARDGRPLFRRITVKVKRAGVQVRSRSGFFGMPDEENSARPERAQLALESSLESPFGSSAVELRLHSSFLSARKNEWLARTSLWVDAHNLTLEGPTNNRAGIIHLLVRAFGVSGAELEGGIDQVLKVSLDAEGYDRAMKYGLLYSTVIRVAKPGPYQVRAALLDQASGKIGTANQFLAIPSQPRRGFLLSGIVFPQMLSKEDDITPAAGPSSFGAGQTVPFAFEVIGGAGEKALMISTILYRDGELVKRSGLSPLHISGKSLHGSLFAKSEMAIPQDVPAGDYRMQVIVSEGAPAPAGRAASQWADVTINGGRPK